MMMSGRRLAEEAQLLAEERWTIAALKKIRNQRNALKIERLQLESLLAAERCKKQTRIAPDTSNATTTEPRPTDIEVSVDYLNNQLLATFMSAKDTHVEKLEILNEEGCNFEKLDLNVTKSIFSPTHAMQFGMYTEEDEDEDEDILDDENIKLDINMLMNADHGSGTEE